MGLVYALLNERNQNYFSSFNAGIPKKNVLGCLLSNLFLNRLDYFVQRLKNSYVTSKKHIKSNPLSAQKTNIKKKSTKQVNNYACPSVVGNDFCSLFYVRYRDTFVISVSARKEAVSILKKIDSFLQKNLYLELEQSKTLIIPFQKGEFTFVGTRIINFREYQKKKKWHQQAVKINRNTLQLHAPTEKILEMLKKNSFVKKDKNGAYQARSLERLINLTHTTILKYYNKVIASFLDYYFFVDNYFSMQKKVAFFLRHSCALTLKLKYRRCSRFKVFTTFGRHLKCPKTKYKLQTRLLAKN
jgi:hypothetical protein